MKNKITIKDKILYLLLPFTIGCSTATATTPKTKTWGESMNKVSGYSQLDYTEPAIEPDWLRKTPRAKGSYFFVGMSNKRSERKDAKNESFNDAMIAFARFCGLNVSVMEEHKDVSIGGNGGVIDTLTRGNTFAKLRADMFMGNVTVEDRYLERYSNFHGGSFMGHAFVVSTLIKVPQEEMETCRANRKTANSYMEEQSETIAKLSKKNTSLENRLQQVERNNQTLAMNQVMQSNKLFKQAGYAKKKPVVKKVVKRNVKTTANSVSKVIAKKSVVKKKKFVPKKVIATNTGSKWTRDFTNSGTNVSKVTTFNKVTKKKFVPKKVIATNTSSKWTRDFTNSGTNVSSNSKRFVQRTEDLDKTNTTVTNLNDFKGCIEAHWGGAIPGVPCESSRNRYEGGVVVHEHYDLNGKHVKTFYRPDGYGVMYTAGNPGQKYMEGTFIHGQLANGDYYHSQTGKKFKRVVNGQFVSLNN